jgi:subtilisin family serine protease
VGIISTYGANDYLTAQGTSMATPHVVGAVSLLWTYRPDLTALEIKQALYNGADTLIANTSNRHINGDKKLNLYQSLKLLDNTPPTLSEAPLVDVSNYCDTQLITYVFTGTDDIELASTPYSFDNGNTRQSENILITGTELST